MIALLVFVAFSPRAIANDNQEIIWLVDQTRYKQYIGCGHDGEFSRPPEFGIVISENGDIIERASTEVWASKVDNQHILLSRLSADGSRTPWIDRYNNIPIRTFISSEHRIEYQSDLTPAPIGSGWFICDARWPSPQRGDHPTDSSSSSDDRFFYLDNNLNQITDIQAKFGVDIGGQKIVWIFDPNGVFVLQDHNLLESTVIRTGKEASMRTLLSLDYKHPMFASLNLFTCYTQNGQRWLYNPLSNRLVKPFYWGMANYTVHQNDFAVMSTGEGELAGVYNTNLKRIGSLGYRHQPNLFTSANILVCNDRKQSRGIDGRVFRAFLIDELANEPLTELDASWIKQVEYRTGPVYAIRNQQDELVIVDPLLKPILTLGKSDRVQRITQSGRIITLNTETNTYSLYDANTELIREFDVAAILEE